MQPKTPLRVNVCIDMSNSFATPDGSFAVGTSDAEMDAAVRVLRASDIVVLPTDVHPPLCPEFVAAGGPFPAHNVVRMQQKKQQQHESEDEDPRTSPCPAPAIAAALAGRRGAVVAPRHVFFQTHLAEASGTPDFRIADLEATFGVPWLADERQLHTGGVEYVVSCKAMFNGATVHTLRRHEGVHVENVPEDEDNAFSLLREEHGHGRGLHWLVTGCVLSICVYQTATNIKQMFPESRVSIVLDACTPLSPPADGEKTPVVDWPGVVRAMCEQIDVECTTTEQLGIR